MVTVPSALPLRHRLLQPVTLSPRAARVNVGETITFVLSSGGGLGLQGNANFQGYVEVDCDFPFAHGWAFLAVGPIGQARVGTTIPALVLPNNRKAAAEESAGQ